MFKTYTHFDAYKRTLERILKIINSNERNICLHSKSKEFKNLMSAAVNILHTRYVMLNESNIEEPNFDHTTVFHHQPYSNQFAFYCNRYLMANYYKPSTYTMNTELHSIESIIATIDFESIFFVTANLNTLDLKGNETHKFSINKFFIGEDNEPHRLGAIDIYQEKDITARESSLLMNILNYYETLDVATVNSDISKVNNLLFKLTRKNFKKF